MVADEQTHTLPSDPEALDRFARFAGFDGRDALAETLLDHLRKVQRHYARLFEDDAERTGTAPALTFPEDADDRGDARLARAARLPQTARSFRDRAGNGSPAAIRRSRARLRARNSPNSCRCCSTSLRGWSSPTQRSRPSTGFSPACKAAGGCSRCSSKNHDLVALVVRILGIAPRLAEILARYPAGDRRAARSGVLWRASRRGEAFRRTRAFARPGPLLRGFPRPDPDVRPGAHVPDRRAHPFRHGFRRAGGRGFRAARRRGDPRAAPQGRRRTSSPSTAAFADSRSRCSRSASSAAAK